ncbi:MAG: ATP-dependent helicase, partial [Lachnospiraceae bacterium]|nr:ATP-dependent helicase [Lachnospiraceae bacterium]
MPLNSKQYQAVMWGSGPCMVLAPPGSGKTLALTKRIEYLIKKGGVDPSLICVLTYTKNAANEMKDRFNYYTNNKYKNVTIGTFHSVFFRVLREEGVLDGVKVLGEGEREKIVKDIVIAILKQKNKECSNVRKEIVNNINYDYIDFKSIADEISKVKNLRKNIKEYEPNSIEKDIFDKVYLFYDKYKQDNKYIDFDDMLTLIYEKLCSDKNLLQNMRKRFQYFMIDEFQDINLLQYEIIKLLVKPLNNIFIVGDDDQSIYGFRGASPNIMQSFKKDFRKTKIIIFDTSYRFGEDIVGVSKKLIRNNTVRFDKNYKGKNICSSIHVQETEDKVDESKYICDLIQYLKKSGGKYKDICVLCRTLRSSKNILAEMKKRNIPYVISHKDALNENEAHGV